MDHQPDMHLNGIDIAKPSNVTENNHCSINGNDSCKKTDDKSQIPNTIPTIELNDNDGKQFEFKDHDDYERGRLFSRSKSPSPSAHYSSTPPRTYRRRCDSTTGVEDGDKNESKVLVIYTGGTIGMIRNDENSKCTNDIS